MMNYSGIGMVKMKICIALILLLFSSLPSLPLFAQSGKHTFSVYVAPVSGDGGKPEDNYSFYRQVVSELEYQHYILAKTEKNAEFSLVGTLSPHAYNTIRTTGKQYIFRLELQDNKTGDTMMDGELVYETVDDVKYTLPSMVSMLVLTIPEDTGRDNWRDKWLYLGAAAFWTPRVYAAENTSTYFANIGGGVYAEFHFLNFMSFEAGMEFASDLINISASTVAIYRSYLFEVPLMLKIALKPGGSFMLEPYGGVQFNVPLNKTAIPPLLSWLAGFQYGVKAGPGVMFVDPRFSMDIGKSKMGPGITGPLFQRYVLHLGIGYKYGFGTRY
jgi:hypothetical protein